MGKPNFTSAFSFEDWQPANIIPTIAMAKGTLAFNIFSRFVGGLQSMIWSLVGAPFFRRSRPSILQQPEGDLLGDYNYLKSACA